MTSSNRIITNTIILYTKIFVNMILSLWTVPLVLRALGQSDYGLYNLVGGVVAMLTFLNSSMTVVTQRFMSVTMGTKDKNRLNQVYNAGIRIHLLLGIIIVVILEFCIPLLFNGFLNVDNGRVNAAIWVYEFMIVSTFFTILAVPFDSTLNAYENMLAFSLIAIIESVLKLFLAISLLNIHFDRLVVYGLGLAIISVLGIIVRITVVKIRYVDLRFICHMKIPRPLYREMLAYAGWNTFGSIAMVGKNQGIAIVLNLFKGTTINASYGIANQINGLISSFTASIQKAISPQLMMHEGANERKSMIEMSFSLVKLATVVFGLMAIPVIIEMKQLIKWWLHDNVPPYSVVFCQLIIIMQLLFQLSSGIALAIDAVGKIKVYRIVLSIVLIANIPLAYLFLNMGLEPYMVLVSMIIIELLCLVVRIYFAQRTATFPIGGYLKSCLLPLVTTLGISMLVGLFMADVIKNSILEFFVVSLVTMMITLLLTYYMVLNNIEKTKILGFCLSAITHIKKAK